MADRALSVDCCVVGGGPAGMMLGLHRLMQQWDFFDFLAEQARRFRGFDLRMEAAVTDRIREIDEIAGVMTNTPDGPLEIRAVLPSAVTKPLSPPLIMKLLGWFPIPRRIPARLVGIGVRPEHIRTAEAADR